MSSPWCATDDCYLWMKKRVFRGGLVGFCWRTWVFVCVWARKEEDTFSAVLLVLGGERQKEKVSWPTDQVIYQVAQVKKVEELKRRVRLSFPRWRGMGGLVVHMDWRKRLTWIGARWSLCILSGESVEMAQWNMKMWDVTVVLHRWWRHLSETGEI